VTGKGEKETMHNKNYIEKLHDKFFYGTITREEKQVLYEYFKDVVCNDGKIHPDILDNFLYTSHPDYGKPAGDGTINIA